MKVTTTINEICNAVNGKLITPADNPDIEITDGYMCDLLSFVIGRAPEGACWITVIGNLNTIAVAVLAELPCIILAENAALDDDAKVRAEQNGIAVICSEKNSFECAIALGKLIGK